MTVLGPTQECRSSGSAALIAGVLIGLLILAGELNALFLAFAVVLIAGSIAYAWVHFAARVSVEGSSVAVRWLPPTQHFATSDVVALETRRVGPRLVAPVLCLRDGRSVQVRSMAGYPTTIDAHLATLRDALQLPD